jgi:hypothetical protein
LWQGLFFGGWLPPFLLDGNMSSLKRLEALEARLTGQEPKERKFFVDGVCDEVADCSNPTIFTDKQGKPLNGWHYVSTNMPLGFDIV